MADDVSDKADKSLQRVQEFDTETLPQEQRLGEAMSFKDAVQPAERVIGLFRQFPRQFLGDLPPTQMNQLVSTADGFFNLLNEILQFDPKQADSYARRTNFINQIKNHYQQVFDQLYQIISYGSSRQRDFSSLERDFRASMQRAEDNAVEVMKKLQDQEAAGARIIEEVRKVAAEQGVSQQALYFREESASHHTESENWRWLTIWAAVALGGYALISMFVHKIPGLTPTTTYEAVQLAISKILIFTVLGYLLLLCARNFLSHKHNEIVNRHRQNALLTFKALVEAAGGAESRDVILTYAAACIFSPQDTGYTKGGDASSRTDMPTSIIQALPKLTSESR